MSFGEGCRKKKYSHGGRDSAQCAQVIIHQKFSPSSIRTVLTRLSDGKHLSAVAIASPHEHPVEDRPNSNLMRELRWYLENFLEFPFHPETIHAEHVLEAVIACFPGLGRLCSTVKQEPISLIDIASSAVLTRLPILPS